MALFSNVREKFNSLRFPLLIIVAFIIHLLGYIFHSISFASPFWLESQFPDITPFRHLGLWQACFNKYSATKLLTPKERIDTEQVWRNRSDLYNLQHWPSAFEGCNDYHSSYMEPLYDRLMTDWFLTTQAFMTIAQTLSVLNIVFLIVLIAVRPSFRFYRPLLHIVRWFEGFAAFSTVISMVVFGFNCRDPSYIPNASWNKLGWAFWLAVVATCLFTIALVILAVDFRRRQDLVEKRVGKVQHHIQMVAAIPAMSDDIHRAYPEGENRSSSRSTDATMNERNAESRATRYTDELSFHRGVAQPSPPQSPQAQQRVAAVAAADHRQSYITEDADNNNNNNYAGRPVIRRGRSAGAGSVIWPSGETDL